MSKASIFSCNMLLYLVVANCICKVKEILPRVNYVTRGKNVLIWNYFF